LAYAAVTKDAAQRSIRAFYEAVKHDQRDSRRELCTTSEKWFASGEAIFHWSRYMDGSYGRKATAQLPGPVCTPVVKDRGCRMISTWGKRFPISGLTVSSTQA
jgi:hypothetical protein